VERQIQTEARASLSAMAATLLACGGAGLIAGAPDWVTRFALAKTPAARFAAAPDAQDRKSTAEAPAMVARASGSSHEPFAGTISAPPPGVDDAPAADQADVDGCRPPSEERAKGEGAIENCSRTLEIRRATALGCVPCPPSPPGRVRASSRH
jgi:hypothetical protein